MRLLNLLCFSFVSADRLSSYSVHEEREVRQSYAHDARSTRISPYVILPIRIAMAQSNLDKGSEYLSQVSDPNSESFGQHWSLQQIHERFAPRKETKAAIRKWLQSAGINRDDISESTSGGWLGIDVAAKVAEALFKTEYYEKVDEQGLVHVGCDRYHVPSHLSNHVDFITPGIGLTSFRKRSLSLPQPSHMLRLPLVQRHTQNFTDVPCGELITPACIRALYNIPTAQRIHKNNSLGIFEFLDVYDQVDLDLFFEHFAENVPRGTHPTLVSINGATVPTNKSGALDESVLDLNLAYSLIYPQNITLYQTGYTEKQAEQLASEASGPMLNRLQIAGGIALTEDILNAVDGSFCTPAAKEQGLDCGTASLTQVLSVSYSAAEINMPFKFAQRVCNEYMKLGLKGHTLLFASGDYGPAGNRLANGNTSAISNACINLDHPQNGLLNGTVFNPAFPASCPYVLSVGATQLDRNNTVKDPETVLHLPPDVLNISDYITFGSSGGFSNYFKRPSYQTTAVNKYLTKHKPAYKTYQFPGSQKVGGGCGIYNTGGRGIPDVAANGANLATFIGGKFQPQFGTSLATPIWASIITMINDERLARGKGPVGFVNPTLYQNMQAFNDITSGFAPGCATEGFAATPGWDPTTGLGTPNYPELLKIFLALP